MDGGVANGSNPYEYTFYEEDDDCRMQQIEDIIDDYNVRWQDSSDCSDQDDYKNNLTE